MGREFDSLPKSVLNPYLGGLLLGLVLFASFFITGQGLGASGGLNRFLVYFEDLIAPEHCGLLDYMGAFAVTAGLGLDEHVARLESQHDDYSAIVLKAN